MCGEFAGGECISRDIKIVVAFHRFIFDGIFPFCPRAEID